MMKAYTYIEKGKFALPIIFYNKNVNLIVNHKICKYEI